MSRDQLKSKQVYELIDENITKKINNLIRRLYFGIITNLNADELVDMDAQYNTKPSNKVGKIRVCRPRTSSICMARLSK